MSCAAQTIQNILAAQGNPDKHDTRESTGDMQSMPLTYWGMQGRQGKLRWTLAFGKLLVLSPRDRKPQTLFVFRA